MRTSFVKSQSDFCGIAKIAIVDITPCVSTQINLCCLKGVELSDAAKHFVLCAESHRTSLGLLSKQETPTK